MIGEKQEDATALGNSINATSYGVIFKKNHKNDIELKTNELAFNDVVLQRWLEYHLALDYNKLVPLHLNCNIFVYFCYMLSFWLFTLIYVPLSRCQVFFKIISLRIYISLLVLLLPLPSYCASHSSCHQICSKFPFYFPVVHINPLNAELNPICYLLALLGAHHFLHVSRIRVKSLTLRQLMLYTYMKHLFLMFLDHTQRRTTVGRTPLDE